MFMISPVLLRRIIDFRCIPEIHRPLILFYLIQKMGGADWYRSMDISSVINEIITQSIVNFRSVVY